MDRIIFTFSFVPRLRNEVKTPGCAYPLPLWSCPPADFVVGKIAHNLQPRQTGGRSSGEKKSEQTHVEGYDSAHLWKRKSHITLWKKFVSTIPCPKVGFNGRHFKIQLPPRASMEGDASSECRTQWRLHARLEANLRARANGLPSSLRCGVLCHLARGFLSPVYLASLVGGDDSKAIFFLLHPASHNVHNDFSKAIWIAAAGLFFRRLCFPNVTEISVFRHLRSRFQRFSSYMTFKVKF